MYYSMYYAKSQEAQIHVLIYFIMMVKLVNSCTASGFKVTSTCFTLVAILVIIQMSKNICQFVVHLLQLVRNVPLGGNRFSKYRSEILKYIRSLMCWISSLAFILSYVQKKTKVTFHYDCRVIVKHLRLNLDYNVKHPFAYFLLQCLSEVYIGPLRWSVF